MLATVVFRRVWRDQQGSHVAQAAAVALAAALLIAALISSSQSLRPGVERAFQCVVAALSGGGSCGLGAARAENGAAIVGSDSTAQGPGTAQTAASIGLDFIPVVGEVKGLIEVFTGTDLVTGEDLGWWRFAGLAGLVGLNEIKHLRHTDQVVEAVGGVRRSGDVLDAGGTARRAADCLTSRPARRGPGLAAPLADRCSEVREAFQFLRNAGVDERRWQEIADAFGPGMYAETLAQDLKVYRYYDGATSSPRGRWLTEHLWDDPVNDLALPGGNNAANVEVWIIPKGTPVLRGPVAPNFGRPGGGTQIYLPDPAVLREVAR
jgi:Flp pilus assembly pilin Flp